jgi:hypothetical protein
MVPDLSLMLSGLIPQLPVPLPHVNQADSFRTHKPASSSLPTGVTFNAREICDALRFYLDLERDRANQVAATRVLCLRGAQRPAKRAMRPKALTLRRSFDESGNSCPEPLTSRGPSSHGRAASKAELECLPRAGSNELEDGIPIEHRVDDDVGTSEQTAQGKT